MSSPWRKLGAAAALALWLICPAQADDLAAQLQQLTSSQSWVTTTRHHRPGDPINVGLVGSRDEIIAALAAAGWRMPVPVNLKSAARIVSSVAFRRAYQDAPVSNLYFLGRKQDLAFEMEVGRSASKRHHVRFWKLTDSGPDGRALWLGAATFDKGVGLSHRSGAVTHHISGDVDAERQFLMDALNKSQHLSGITIVPGKGAVKGRNGGGDAWWSDGNLDVAVIAP